MVSLQKDTEERGNPMKVLFEMACPCCGKPVTDFWVSNNGEGVLVILKKFGEEENFTIRGHCSACHSSVFASVRREIVTKSAGIAYSSEVSGLWAGKGAIESAYYHKDPNPPFWRRRLGRIAKRPR